MTTALRPMRWWDIDRIIPMEAQLFGPTAWTAGQFWGELARVPETRHYVVVEDGDAIIGYAGLYAVRPDADVQTIAVAADRQGQGHGAALLDELAREAQARECTRLTLEVRADNDPAIRLYDRQGFERIALRRGYYAPGIDAIIMQRRIGGGS